MKLKLPSLSSFCNFCDSSHLSKSPLFMTFHYSKEVVRSEKCLENLKIDFTK